MEYKKHPLAKAVGQHVGGGILGPEQQMDNQGVGRGQSADLRQVVSEEMTDVREAEVARL